MKKDQEKLASILENGIDLVSVSLGSDAHRVFGLFYQIESIKNKLDSENYDENEVSEDIRKFFTKLRMACRYDNLVVSAAKEVEKLSNKDLTASQYRRELSLIEYLFKDFCKLMKKMRKEDRLLVYQQIEDLAERISAITENEKTTAEKIREDLEYMAEELEELQQAIKIQLWFKLNKYEEQALDALPRVSQPET